MDAKVRAAIEKAVALVKEKCAKELGAAVTLMDLERLTVAIGDEIGRQLCEEELKDRAKWAGKWKPANARSVVPCVRRES